MCSRVYIADSGEIKENELKDSAIPESFVPPSLRSWWVCFSKLLSAFFCCNLISLIRPSKEKIEVFVFIVLLKRSRLLSCGTDTSFTQHKLSNLRIQQAICSRFKYLSFLYMIWIDIGYYMYHEWSWDDLLWWFGRRNNHVQWNLFVKKISCIWSLC